MSSRFVTEQQKREQQAAEKEQQQAEARRKKNAEREKRRRQYLALEELLPAVLPVWQEYADARGMILGPVRRWNEYGIGCLSFVMSPSRLWIRRYAFEFYQGEGGVLALSQTRSWSPHETVDLAQALADATGRKVVLHSYGGSDPELGGTIMYSDWLEPQQQTNGE